MASNTENRVLALSMRPKFLKDLVGQDKLRDSLLSQFASGRIPHFFIIAGAVGIGKTTLARILALALQVKTEDFEDLTETDWDNYKKYDIQEINAANRNGVDDVRGLVEVMKYKPLPPSKVKVVIMDEAHQLTSAAQNALLTEIEDVHNHVFYIFCTSTISKLIPALRRRAFIILPSELDENSIETIVQRAVVETGFEGDVEKLIKTLHDNDIVSPGLILQAVERYFSGIPEVESVTAESCKVDTMEVCRAVATANWTKAAALLKDLTKTDVITVRNCLLGYLKSMLLKATAKAYRISKAIQAVASSADTEANATCVPLLLASICIACEQMKA